MTNNFTSFKRLFVLVLILNSFLFFSNSIVAQSNATKVCPTSYNEPYTWPTHANWFFGAAQIMDFGATGTSAPANSTKVGPGAPFWAYESAASVSDEAGNLILYTNGVKLWDGNGNEIPVPGGRLLTGAEIVNGDAGSATQGVLMVKHPLNPNEIYIFTTDDAVGGQNNNGNITNGFNYFVFDRQTNTVSGPTRLGNYRCTEQVAATWHANGVDLWICTHASAQDPATTRDFYAYQLSCSGLNETPVVSQGEFQVKWTGANGGNSNERSTLNFEMGLAGGNTIRAVATYHNGGGTWDPVNSVSLLEFNRALGTFNHVQGLGDGTVAASNPYDAEFSPSGDRIFVSFQADPWGTLQGRIGYYDLNAGGAYTQVMTTGTNQISFGSLKLGGNGTLYAGKFNAGNFLAPRESSLGTITNMDGAANGTLNGYNVGANGVSYSLPNMFIPPRDWVIIKDTTDISECDLPFNINTFWHCKTDSSAENTQGYENAYSVDPSCAGCTIDPVTGVFDAPGAGTYTVYFEICEIKDTMTFDVLVCGCDADIQDGPYEICAGDEFLLDSLIISNSGDGVWTIDSLPTGATGVSLDEGADTIFQSSIAATPGTYKLKYTITGGGCEDSTYIMVKPVPQAIIDPFGPLCSDSVAVALTGSPTIANDTTGAWFINNNLQLDGQFDPENNPNIIIGQNTITYAVELNGCFDTTSINVQVKERAAVTVDPAGPFCASVTTVTFTATPDTGVWLIDNGATIGNNGSFNPSNAGQGTYEVIHQVQGQCGASDTIDVVVNPVKDATINTDTGSYCITDPQFNLNAAFPGGTWHINDTSTAAIGGVFNPEDYAPGDYNVIYVQPDPCGDLDTVRITVLPLKDPTITAAQTVFCADDDSVQFTGAQAGGTWSGAGINPNTGWFNPANGTDDGNPYDIIYTIGGNCGAADTIQVTVNPLRNATINNFPAANDTLVVCVLDPDPTFDVAEGGGTWNNPNVNLAGTNVTIDIQALTNNGNNMVTNAMLIYSLGAPCPDADTVWITTTNQLDASINAAGPFCDDDDNFQLTRPNSAAGTWSSDCGGCLSSAGMFNPSAAGPGTHEITYTIAGNCGDQQSINITVNATPDPTILNGDTVRDCENGNLVFLQTAEAGGTWNALNDDKGGLDPAGPAFLPNISGDGTFVIEYAFGGQCPAADTLVLVFDPVPVITFNNDGPYCDTEDPIQLNVTPTGGTWTGAGITDQVQGIFDPGTANVGTHQTPGQNLLVYQVDQGLCSASDRDTLYVIRQVDATIDPVGPFCNLDSVVELSAVDSLGVWTGNGITDANQGIFNPNGLPAGTTTITHTIAGQCGDVKQLDILIEAPLDPTITDQSTICLGSQNQIQFEAVNEGTWSGDNVDANGLLTVVDSGDYMIVNTIGGLCPVEDTSYFRVEFVPTVQFEADIINDCVGFTETFTDVTDTSASGAVVTSTWTFGNGLQSTSRLNATSPYNSPGTYDVTLTNTYANGCSSTTTREGYITAYPYPTANFNWEPNPPSVLNNAVQFFNLSQGGNFYAWDFDTREGNTPPSDEYEPSITFNLSEADTIDVTLVTTSINGCSDTIVKPVPILDFFNIFVPNAFSPHNRDGLNDTFYPKGRNITSDDYLFMIFNRWGELIWQTNQPGVGWDGTVDNGLVGDPQQIDVYVWKLQVRDQFTGDKIEMVGTVTLIN
jgi:gliding motility-associated-like protein